MLNLIRPILTVMALAMTATSAADHSLVHPLFTDHMVLQRDKANTVWGWAKPYAPVKATMAGKTIAAIAAEDGRWEAGLPPLEAGGPYVLKVESDDETVTVGDILIGDVWICSGQSNMEWQVINSNNAEDEIQDAQHPRIRLFTVPKKTSEEPLDLVAAAWQICTPETIPKFSAVAYFFGRELQEVIDVPIGLIHTSWGGTVAEAWTSAEALSEMEDFAPAVKEMQERVKLSVDQFNSGRPPQPTSNNPNQVTVLYNGMISPLLPYGIKGAVWYQGESNAGRAAQYRRLLPTMIGDWRRRFQNEEFPFLIVQLANFMEVQKEPVQDGWAALREAQSLTAANDPKVGLAITTDIGSATDIHPRNKQDVGRRLALAAVEVAYEDVKIVTSGPRLREIKELDSAIRLEFDHVGGGLTTKGGTDLTGFAIAGEDQKFVWAKAVIRGPAVVVSSAEVAKPVAVRYNWANNPIGNLFNKEGLPAGPFRTDLDSE